MDKFYNLVDPRPKSKFTDNEIVLAIAVVILAIALVASLSLSRGHTLQLPYEGYERITFHLFMRPNPWSAPYIPQLVEDMQGGGISTIQWDEDECHWVVTIVPTGEYPKTEDNEWWDNYRKENPK